MKKPAWTRMQKRSVKEEQERPPIWLRDHSNGEYYHFQTPYERKLEKFIMQKADENARRVGIPRRDFLASAMGMATSLYCINLASGCSSDSDSGKNGGNVGAGGGDGGGAGGTGGSGGGGPVRPPVCDTYDIPPEAMYDEDLACAAIGGDEFIFDIQTHFFEPDGEWIEQNPGYVTVLDLIVDGPAGSQSWDMNAYIDALFCNSDTKMTVLSTWPGALCSEAADAFFAPNPAPCGLPMSSEGAARYRDIINEMANSPRVINHAMILPNDPAGVDFQLEIMERVACSMGLGAWKLYPAWGPDAVGWFLDDPDIGIPVIEKGLELGVNTFCAHKGLPIPGFDVEHNIPREVGRVAKMYPGANFIIYHSSIRAGGSNSEGPYVEGDWTGVNALITSMREAGVGPNENVFAELGSSWAFVMNDATQAAHYLGKLLKYVGEDNICWGTDALVGGTPQPLIEGLRTATIPQDLRDQYGYPELTPQIKAKIFGLNSALVYGVDAAARRCQIDQCSTALLKRRLDSEVGERRWSFRTPMGPRNWKEYVRQGKEMIKRGVPG